MAKAVSTEMWRVGLYMQCGRRSPALFIIINIEIQELYEYHCHHLMVAYRLRPYFGSQTLILFLKKKKYKSVLKCY